jgi:hypothetical protein
MRKVIHNIRNRPDHHKDKIIWLSAAVAIALLLAVWALVGNGRPTTPDENFFQNFNEDLEEGKNIIPADPLAP